MRFRFSTIGRVLAALMLTAVTAAAAYDASGTWEGELCGRPPDSPGNECTGLFQVEFIQDSSGNITGFIAPAATFTATLVSTNRRFNTYDMSMVDGTSCLALSGTVRIDTTTSTLTGTLSGTREDCTDTRPVTGSVTMSRI
jgi:hypothetical protein